mgnify:CR=1 FL=1
MDEFDVYNSCSFSDVCCVGVVSVCCRHRYLAHLVITWLPQTNRLLSDKRRVLNQRDVHMGLPRAHDGELRVTSQHGTVTTGTVFWPLPGTLYLPGTVNSDTFNSDITSFLNKLLSGHFLTHYIFLTHLILTHLILTNFFLTTS